MKDWRSVALVALVALVLGRESGYTQPDNKTNAVPVNPRNPITIQIVDPVPVVLVTPVNPRPLPPGPVLPIPGPVVDPAVPDTALAQTAREYLRKAPAGLQSLWISIADQIDRGEIADKSAAVHVHSQLSAPMNSALDQMFSLGMDAKGKIVNPAAISTPLRQSAAALGRSD